MVTNCHRERADVEDRLDQSSQKRPAPEPVPAGPPSSDRASTERPSIWSLALPSILGNLLYSAVALVQTKFVGELGAPAVAAVGAGQRVFFALQAVMLAISAGTTALVARAWGADDYDEAARVTMASLVLAGVFAIVMTIPGVLLARPVASIFGLDAATLDYAADNIRWLTAFNLAFAVNFILGAALRAAGDAWSPLWIAAIVNVINVPLLYAFVFGRWGFPEMGVAGAAIATGIAFTVGGVLLIGLWLKQRFRLKYVSSRWFRKPRFKRLLDIGYPAGLEMVVFQVGFFIFMMLIGNFYGTEAFAAYNVGGNLLMVVMVAGFGFSIAGATLVGQHLGAGDFAGATRSGWIAMGYALVSMGLLGALVIVFANELATFFLGDDLKTIRYTVQFTWILGAMTPLLAVEFAIGGSLRGAGDTRFPLLATAIGLLGVRCGLAATFTYMALPVAWVFGALIGDYLVKGAMLLWRFRSGRWRTAVRLEPDRDAGTS